jgi:hypothetical protein
VRLKLVWNHMAHGSFGVLQPLSRWVDLKDPTGHGSDFVPVQKILGRPAEHVFQPKLELCQGLRQISSQINRVFQANAETQHTICNTHHGAGFGANIAVGSGGRMGHQGFGIAEII